MSETNNGVEVLAATGGGQAMMAPGGGLSGGKLALATAETGDVLAGKTYYAGDKELKTGTLALADATATESDVASGKTFFAGDNTIKTGTKLIVKKVLRSSQQSIKGSSGTWNQTVDVKSVLPSKYSQLTVNNFSVQMTSYYMGTSTSWSTLYCESLSYNSSTGVLSYRIRYTGGSSDAIGTWKDTVLCFYV